MGVLTFNALRAAREVIVPLETSDFAIHGVQKLLETIALLSDRIGHDLAVRILPTLYDGRTRYARDTLAEIRSLFGDLCFDTVVRNNVKLREAARRGKPIVSFARSANGAQDYGALAIELALTPAPDEEIADDFLLDTDGSAREVVIHFRDLSATDVRAGGRLQRLGPRQGRPLPGAGRWGRPGLDQGPHAAARHLPLPLRGGRRVARGPGNPVTAPGAVGGRTPVLIVR